jgi:hypothetical protein
MPTPYAVSSDLVSAWPAKSLEVATYLDTALASKTDLAMVQNAQTGSSYSYALADASKLLTMSNASANTVLVTKQATVTWVTGTQLRVMNLGAGVTTLVADTGVTINGNVSLKQYQGGTLIRTASDVWLFVPTASSSGMDLITPTSVAGSGVTLSGGLVTFTAASTVSVNGCFTSAYDIYRIVMYGGASTTGENMDARLRLAGSDNSTANSYVRQLLRGISTATSSAQVTGSSFATIAISDANIWVSTLDVVRPALASMTGFIGSFHGTSVASSDYIGTFGGRHNQTVAYDGISIIPQVGTITGVMRIYGMRNS